MAMRAYYAVLPPAPNVRANRPPSPAPRWTTSAIEACADLVPKAISHSHPTPVWNLRRPSEPAQWLLISSDSELFDQAWRAAPPCTQVVLISSMSLLQAALGRSHRATVVVDAREPSVSFEGALGLLASASREPHVLLWRVDAATRARLGTKSMKDSWLAFEGDVSAREMVHLVSLGI